MNDARGSMWRKWDLQIHSPLSVLNNQYPKLGNGEPDWESFLQKLESLDVAAIGITDYFTIDGYKALGKFKEQGRLNNIRTVLPNIEFRLKTIVSSRKDGEERRLNLHVILSDEVPKEDIEEHFLHDIHFYFKGDPGNRDERRKLKPSNLETLGRELLEQHDRFREMGLSPIELGTMQAVVDHEEITDLLTDDSRFKGKYIVVLAMEGLDEIGWDTQAHAVRKGLLQKSGMVFSSNPKTRQWCLGKTPYAEGVQNFIREFKTLKPCIHGSDAHKINDIGRPCAQRGEKGHKCDENPSTCELRYCWIKADPTFEGFKQLLYEPEERVAVQEKDPSPVISNYTISRVRISGAVINDELSMGGADIELNPFLVAVVGAKGAGKTAFVDLIANCFMDRRAMDDTNSFVRRISEYKPKVETKLFFKDSSEFSKTFGDKNFLEESQIVYIAQSELEKYIGEKSDLDQRIKELIFESPQIKNTMLSFNFDEATFETEEIQKRIASKNRLIEELRHKTSSLVIQEIDHEKKKVDSDLGDIDKRIKELEKLQSIEATEAAQKRQNQLGLLKSQLKDLSALRSTLEWAFEFLGGPLGEFNEAIKTVNELMQRLKIEAKIPELSYSHKTNLEKVLESVKSEMKKIVSQTDKMQKELETLEAGAKEHARLLERRRELQATAKSVEEKGERLEENKRKVQEAETDRKQLMKGLFESVVTQKKNYKQIIETFSNKKAEILSDIDFVAEIRFNNENFIDRAEGIMDNRKVLVRGDDDNPPAFEKLILLSHAVAIGEETKIDELVEEMERCNKDFRWKIKSQPVTVGHFYDFLYANYMQVIPVVKYKNTDLKKLSLGQKATVLIKIYLAHGDKPIIIDSHDDHLDNEFIMDELVRAIRKAKNDRQIILVSNNGNVVINSDAEQIVVANRKDGNISYVFGSIENPEIRERVLRVLEGGREAFKRRQQKYRLIS